MFVDICLGIYLYKIPKVNTAVFVKKGLLVVFILLIIDMVFGILLTVGYCSKGTSLFRNYASLMTFGVDIVQGAF